MATFFFFFFFFFFVSGLKLDEKSIENGLEGQKFLVVCLFWGGCHHPNELIIVVAAVGVCYWIFVLICHIQAESLCNNFSLFPCVLMM